MKRPTPRGHRLGYEITAVLAIKLLLLVALKLTFFNDPPAAGLDERAVADAILHAGAVTADRSDASYRRFSTQPEDLDRDR